MSLDVRAVRLSVTTDAGDAGFERRLDSRLIVIRGSNTVGKSLLMQAILFGLGAEALFATRKGVLTRAMTSEVEMGTAQEVRSSFVELVVGNAEGNLLTIRRAARTPSGNPSETDLVQTWDGDVWDSRDRGPSNDYLTARGGTAVEARGYHRLLAEFAGLTLPQVQTYQQRFVPLYLQVILGLAYVDQKRGWGGIVPQVPTAYQIVEPLRRAVEFVLRLDVLLQSTSRQELIEQEARLREQESRLRGRLDAVAGLHGGRVTFPELGEVAAGDREHAPEAQVLISDEWVTLGDRLAILQQARRDRALRDVIGTGDGLPDFQELEGQLSTSEASLATEMARLEALNSDEELVHIQLGALGRRLATLDEEFTRYGQLVTLHDLGSVIAPHSIEDGDCPTCHQSLEQVESIEGNALPVEETREALRQDRQTVKALINEAEERLAFIEVRRNAWTQSIRALRLQVRALRSDLTAATGTPSTTVIQQAVEQEQELARLATLEAQFVEDADEWSVAAADLAKTQESIRNLGRLGWSTADAEKVAAWTASLQGLLELFDFNSSKPGDVEIDEAMKPVVDGYDIGFQGSASDGIRLRWAYLLSLLETSVSVRGNHPGLLMMDEPGQQGVETESLAAMYRHVAAESSRFGQIFLTTSVPIESIDDWIGDTPRTLIDLETDYLLQRL